MKLSTVLLYSTIDYRWLNECLAAASAISDEVIVVTCEKLWNGDSENQQLLKESTDILNLYNNVKSFKVPWESGHTTFFFESQCRAAGIVSTSLDTDYILFLDTDEIVDIDKFKDWIDTKEYQNYDSMRLANYWYFREKKYRAKIIEDSVVLIKKKLVYQNNQIIIPTLTTGRQQYHELIKCKKKGSIMGPDGYPMIHHYSWVRTKEEMIAKVKCWGHNTDRDWISLVEEEFSRPFNGKCFIDNRLFDEV